MGGRADPSTCCAECPRSPSRPVRRRRRGLAVDAPPFEVSHHHIARKGLLDLLTVSQAICWLPSLQCRARRDLVDRPLAPSGLAHLPTLVTQLPAQGPSTSLYNFTHQPGLTSSFHPWLRLPPCSRPSARSELVATTSTRRFHLSRSRPAAFICQPRSPVRSAIVTCCSHLLSAPRPCNLLTLSS